MDEETHQSLLGPKEQINLRSSMNANHLYGSIAGDPEETQTLISNTNSSMPSRRRAYIAVTVLCYVNMLNYMDRYTIAGKGWSSILKP